MAEKEVQAKFRIRTDTSANWFAANPVLLKGELAYEEDTKMIKIGDGKSAWNLLPYFRSESATTGAMQKQVILNYAFPVGSIKTTTTNENPGDTFGGVWVCCGQGKLPLSADEEVDGETCYYWKRTA